MKIPAHLLSPTPSNSKGSQNAAIQSVAEFSNEQSESPKDFFAAMKSLQNLMKPQKDNEQLVEQGKENATSKTSTIASKVAELKLADPKIENVEQQEPNQEALPDFVPSTHTKAPKNEAHSILKAVSIEEAVSSETASDGIEFAESAEQTEQSLISNSSLSPAVASTTALTQRGVFADDENMRRTQAPQLELSRAIKREAKTVDQAPINQNQIAAKSDARFEVPIQQSQQRLETPPELKSNLENTQQIQIKNTAALQLSTTNGSAMQPAPPPPAVAAKDISAQVTRHLNSELLNMDLRTQVVSERAATGAINSSVLTLQLHPIGLGRVQAEIRKEGELVRIKLTVEAKGTFEIMKNDIDALKAAMRALGTAEGDVMLTQGNINRLPNEAANNGQGFFAHDRNDQSAMQGQQNRDQNGDPRQRLEGDETGPSLQNPNQSALGADNSITI